MGKRRKQCQTLFFWALISLLMVIAAMKLKDAYSLESESEVVQSCPTLCATVDYRPPGSSVHGILQARTLEWVAISFSTPWKESYNQPRQHIEKQRHYFANKVKSESEVAQSCPTFATPWTVAHQAPRSMGVSRQEYWSGVPCPPPGDLPHPGIKLESLMSPALGGRFMLRFDRKQQNSVKQLSFNKK